MIELSVLEQFVVFAKCGTLSAAAEKLFISQPTLTRSMRKLEEDLGVTLFERSKNKMVLNENGKFALSHAQKILEQSSDMVRLVRSFDRQRNTISIGACAPMPVYFLVQSASRLFPSMTVSSEIKDIDILVNGLKDETYQVIILPYKPDNDSFYITSYGKEKLFFALPENHPKAKSQGLYMSDLDGENMILMSQIGFWSDFAERKMPHSRFLVQNERFDFDELVQSSVLPNFTTDVSIKFFGKSPNRVIVPILDEDADVTFYLCCLDRNKSKLKSLMECKM
ncbi:MAG: LysR family transcriptional regulator [Firmicutes bacterium]|nr:LysR family transcriptional regulator [Bacillota bacterium]